MQMRRHEKKSNYTTDNDTIIAFNETHTTKTTAWNTNKEISRDCQSVNTKENGGKTKHLA